MRRLLLLLALTSQPLAAQTADWARVTIGLSAGSRSGATLWDVAAQPILSSNHMAGNGGAYYPSDVFQLHRDVSIGLTISAQGTFYTSPSFGWTFDLNYLGLKLNDSCTMIHDGGDPELANACAYVGSSQKFGQGIDPLLGYHDATGVDHSATAMLIEGGIIVRPFKPAEVQPFVKVMGGFATTPHSTVRMESVYGVDPAATYAPLDMVIYEDYSPPAVRPVLTGALGVTTAPSSGLQVHVEARGTFLPLSVVTGAAASQALQPPNGSAIKSFLSILVGLDVALKRERGKRY